MKKINLTLLLLVSQLTYAVTVEDHPLIYESYGHEYQGKYPQAIEPMTQILLKKPDDYFVNYRLGWLFSLHQKYKNAEEHYKKAAQILPSSLEPWLALSLLSINLGEWEKAMNFSEEVMERNKDHYYGNLRYITAAIKLKKFEKALNKASSILRSYPTDAVFLEQKAYSLENLGKISDAKKAIMDLKVVSPQSEYVKIFILKYK
jgi:tetratricopeptide (TPR) repeat protein